MAPKDRVLVLDVGEAPYALAVARSLGRAGYQVHYGFPIGSPCREAGSRYCAGVLSYPDPSFALDDFHRWICKAATSFRFIVPAKERTLLATAQIKSQVESQGAVVPIADYEILRTATDKLEMLRLANSIGVPTPRTIITETLPELHELASTLGFPFVMKVASEIGLRPIERHDIVDSMDATLFASKFGALVQHGPVIVQEFVRGTGAGIALLYSGSRELVAYSGHKRLFEQFSDGGPSVLATTFVDPQALTESRRLLETLRWKGIAMVEFRLSDRGVPVFMEVNPRFWGTLTLAIASGVDFPRLLLENFGSPAPGGPVGPTRKRNYFSFEVLTTSLTSPPEKRPRMTPLALQLSQSLAGLSVREFQGWDVRPSVVEFLHQLRARGTRHRIAQVSGLFFGPATDYRKLSRWGITTVVDLRESVEVAPQPLPIPGGLHRIDFPIEDDTGIDAAVFSKLVSVIDEAASRGAVYIHCRLGRGRAPMVVAGCLVGRGTPIGRAFQEVYEARPYATLQPSQKAAVYLLDRALHGNNPTGVPIRPPDESP